MSPTLQLQVAGKCLDESQAGTGADVCLEQTDSMQQSLSLGGSGAVTFRVLGLGEGLK